MCILRHKQGLSPRNFWFFFFILALLRGPGAVSASSSPDPSSAPKEIREERLAPIAAIVEEAIRAEKTPGAVVLVGHRGRIVYRQAFGHRALEPGKLPMTIDTIFDLSSLTKVVATAPAVMQLVEKGKIRLQDPVANYWPEFKAEGKDLVTVHQLLTHYSGLRAGLDLKRKEAGHSSLLKKIAAERPGSIPGTQFLYSDLNFIVLGELISRVSGQPLDVYCARNLFEPLGMKDTGFRPP
jgi:CubicO group peptidase (beta-lactamase class C family)